MLPADGPVLAGIYRASIEELTAEDYSPAQQEAWMAFADDEEAFGGRLAGALTIIATRNREPVGFASLAGDDRIDMLYVRPDVAGQGVGKALCDALETLAAARGRKRVTVDASDTARPFFAHRGYTAVQRNTVERNGEWLGNTTMEKALKPLAKGPLQ
jgi:putative acetyltransferase